MSDIDKLKKMQDKYKDLFKKDWDKSKKEVWAKIIASLNLTIKYLFIFDKEEK